MENVASDIPIYKIYHIRSPDITPSSRQNTRPTTERSSESGASAASAASAGSAAAAESALSPEYNVIYVF